MHNIYVNQVALASRHQLEALETDPSAEALRGRDPDWLELRDLASALARIPEEQRAVLLLVGSSSSRTTRRRACWKSPSAPSCRVSRADASACVPS
jgi:hypothetical protein